MKARAVVKVTVEVQLNQPWDENCSVSQIRKQAAESARGQILNQLDVKGIRIVDTDVTVVLVDED